MTVEMSPGMSPGDHARGGPGPYLLCLAIVLGFHACFILFRLVPVLDGNLLGPDSYMHLVHASRLFETGAWFDATVPRANAPFGDILNWTRPFDVLLLAGAWAASPLLGFDKALFWTGVVVSPLLQCAVVVTFAWAVAPMFDYSRRILAMIVLLVQPAIIIYALAGRADHHVLILWSFVVAMGLTMRLLMRPYSPGLSLATGAALGIGVWFSVEVLLALAIIFAATALHWIVGRRNDARKYLVMALGLLLAMVVALAAQRPPTEYVLAEYDRISVVHLLVAVLALGFWWLAARTEARIQGRGGRMVLALAGAVVAGGLLWLVYPDFFAGPLTGVDPRLQVLWLQKIANMNGFLPVSGVTTARFLFYLGPVLITVPYLVWVLTREHQGSLAPAWRLVGVATAVFLPLSLMHGRFSPFAAVVIAIPLTDLIGRFRSRLEGQGPSPGVLSPGVIVKRAFGTAGLLVGFSAAGLVLVSVLKLLHGTAGDGAQQVRAELPCRVKDVAAQLGDPRGLGARRQIVLGPIDDGPELLFRTRHSVVGTAYHRNQAGILDTFDIFAVLDDAGARRLVNRRGVDLILVCIASGARSIYSTATRTDGLYRRLAEGRSPPWLRPVPWQPELATGYRLFEVLR